MLNYFWTKSSQENFRLYIIKIAFLLTERTLFLILRNLLEKICWKLETISLLLKLRNQT